MLMLLLTVSTRAGQALSSYPEKGRTEIFIPPPFNSCIDYYVSSTEIKVQIDKKIIRQVPMMRIYNGGWGSG